MSLQEIEIIKMNYFFECFFIRIYKKPNIYESV